MYTSLAIASLMALATAASAMPTAQPLGFGNLKGLADSIPSPDPRGPPFDNFESNNSTTGQPTGGTPKVALFNLGASVTPSGVTLKNVFFGQGIIIHRSLISGTQDYTCDPTTLTFTNNTAEAQLFDVTCDWTGTTAPVETSAPSGVQASVQHFFVPNPSGASGALTPSFHQGSQFFDGSKVASVPSSDPSTSVPTVLLSNVAGTLAKNIVRTNVDGGVPSTTKCTAGQTTAVPYHANYLFFD
jgi:hypothetical protein